MSMRHASPCRFAPHFTAACLLMLFVLVFGASALAGLTARAAAQRQGEPRIVGRWDLALHTPRGERYPSWLEVRRSGFATLVGQFVGVVGSTRPISRVTYENGRVRFAVPPQWEPGTSDLRFDGRLLPNGRLAGTLRTSDNRRLRWSAVRAPSLRRKTEPAWGTPVPLFNGKSLTGWKLRLPRAPDGPPRLSNWVVRYGLLRNRTPGYDLMTTRAFTDFKLHAEFRYPKGGNSGIYLRGRYEAQIEDNYGRDPESHQIGGIYGFLTPRVNAAKRAGEWQTMDITLVGRRVTLVLNGETVLDGQEIPGITGGALDSNEGAPGPILLQGDHGPIDFRNIVLTPAR